MGMTKTDDAHRIFLRRFTCSAAVFSAFAPDPGMDAGTAMKVACGFGAGIPKTGNICGAVSGGILVIGPKYGTCIEGDDAAPGRTRKLVCRFTEDFTETNGPVNCPKLPGYDLTDPEAFAAAQASGLFIGKCPLLVRDAAEIIDELLATGETGAL
jgi:C_GCAxxG_C_C family probable redox protein